MYIKFDENVHEWKKKNKIKYRRKYNKIFIYYDKFFIFFSIHCIIYNNL